MEDLTKRDLPFLPMAHHRHEESTFLDTLRGFQTDQSFDIVQGRDVVRIDRSQLSHHQGQAWIWTCDVWDQDSS